jgi:hypothetical protein
MAEAHCSMCFLGRFEKVHCWEWSLENKEQKPTLLIDRVKNILSSHPK